MERRYQPYPPGVRVLLDMRVPIATWRLPRQAFFPRCGAARTAHAPLFLIGRVPRGFDLGSGATQGPGEVLFIFWALARSTQTGLVLSDFCPPSHLSPSRENWRRSWRPAQLSPHTMTMRGAAMAGAAAKEP
jgi:hypothetical protein